MRGRQAEVSSEVAGLVGEGFQSWLEGEDARPSTLKQKKKMKCKKHLKRKHKQNERNAENPQRGYNLPKVAKLSAAPLQRQGTSGDRHTGLACQTGCSQLRTARRQLG